MSYPPKPVITYTTGGTSGTCTCLMGICLMHDNEAVTYMNSAESLIPSEELDKPQELSAVDRALQKYNAKLPMTKAEMDLLTKDPDGTIITLSDRKYVSKHGTYYRVKEGQ